MWNNLPESVINSKTVKAFKINLDKHWNNIEFKFDYKKAAPRR